MSKIINKNVNLFLFKLSKYFFSFPLFTTVHKICVKELTPKDLIEQMKINTSK